METVAKRVEETQIVRQAHYARSVAAGGFVFTAGQLALDENSQIVGADIRAQTRLALENLSRVLAERGLGLGDVVKMTVWLRRAVDFAGFNEVYAEMFGEHRPPRSTVVSELVLPTALIELEAVARQRT